jgi:ribosome recycling factor
MTDVSTALAEATHKMEQAVGHLKEELAGIRTGRASPAVLNRITVEYYGTPVPLNQLAGVSVPEPRLLQIQPFDKTAVGAIEKAIQSSDLGITPSNDGNVIRLAFPAQGAGQTAPSPRRGGPRGRSQRASTCQGRCGEA